MRSRALKGLGASAVLGAAWIAIVLWLTRLGFDWFGPSVGVPLVPFLVFLTELVTGRRFLELARRWDALAGWQRGVLGLAIVAIAGIVIVVGVGVALSIWASGQ